MRLRPFLGWLITAAIVPLAIFGVIVAALLVRQTHQTFDEGVRQRVLATSAAIEATMEGTIATLSALSAALEVDATDFRGFRAVAQRILGTQPNWSNINVAEPSGQQVMNLQRPQGAKLHSIAGVDDSLEIITRTRRPVINDIGYGTATMAWDIAVRVPIIRDDEIRYILTGVVKPEAIAEAMAARELPSGWNSYVVDRRGRLVAGAPEGDGGARPGAEIAQRIRTAISAAKEGWSAFEDAGGSARRMFVHTLPATGWTLVVEVPGAAAYAFAGRAAALIAAGLAVALVIALALSRVLGRRRLLAPIEAMAGAAVAIQDGKPARIPHVHGVTELNELSQALRSAVEAMHERQELARREREALESADRAKTEFIAMLSHELRNPLAALTAAAHVMKLSGASARNAAEVQPVIERQTRHMTRLVEDLLDMSRITMGKVNLVMETLDLGALAAGLVATWRAAGRFDRHRVFAEIAEAWVRADRARMEQVLSNLLDNGLKFTPPGKSVRVRASARDGEALLEVRDEGEGLSAALQQHAFELFVQGERSLDRARGGLGIGLALVKRIVDLHAGSVEAASEGEGRGAVFRVRLPLVPAPAVRTSRAERRRPRRAKPRRVLLVEDNDDTRRMVSAALADAGHQVVEASDGGSALSLAAEVAPDAVLLDIGLPDLDGYEVARRLRAEDPARRTLLIAVTGYGQKEDRERAVQAGFDLYLTKPLAPEALERALAVRL